MKGMLFFIFLIALLLGVICLLGPSWIPGELSREHWVNFITISMMVLPFSVFFSYRRFYHRTVRLKEPSDVLKLRKPWITTVWFVLGIQCIGSFAIGWFVISQEKTLSIVMHIFYLASLEGILGMLVYWVICCLLPLPKRVKYIPFFKSLGR